MTADKTTQYESNFTEERKNEKITEKQVEDKIDDVQPMVVSIKPRPSNV